MLRGPQSGTFEGSTGSSLAEAVIDRDPSTVEADVSPKHISHNMGASAYRAADYYTAEGLHVTFQGRNGRIVVQSVL